jgi:hypothetical protein
MLKSIFETEILQEMENSLVKQANNKNLDNVEKAIDYLNLAIDIFEDAGLNSQADQILNVLTKIAKNAKPKKPKDPRKISDRHTKGLTSEKAIENLKHHGTVFNMADVSNVDDILNADINIENYDELIPDDEAPIDASVPNVDLEDLFEED